MGRLVSPIWVFTFDDLNSYFLVEAHHGAANKRLQAQCAGSRSPFRVIVDQMIVKSKSK
jgi:hypothetical protein